ncbi:uncharacterized protein BcabD6B2_26900 [Babesia caballi]|uniref:Uncharacterized protein n=1 Tax=Babesia caballi TaxID=5871 RepID=A0AAV4LUJ6_BABCB|nr:hypothetical protein, conserved [Babesia caballi]
MKTVDPEFLAVEGTSLLANLGVVLTQVDGALAEHLAAAQQVGGANLQLQDGKVARNANGVLETPVEDGSAKVLALLNLEGAAHEEGKSRVAVQRHTAKVPNNDAELVVGLLHAADGADGLGLSSLEVHHLEPAAERAVRDSGVIVLESAQLDGNDVVGHQLLHLLVEKAVLAVDEGGADDLVLDGALLDDADLEDGVFGEGAAQVVADVVDGLDALRADGGVAHVLRVAERALLLVVDVAHPQVRGNTAVAAAGVEAAGLEHVEAHHEVLGLGVQLDQLLTTLGHLLGRLAPHALVLVRLYAADELENADRLGDAGGGAPHDGSLHVRQVVDGKVALHLVRNLVALQLVGLVVLHYRNLKVVVEGLALPGFTGTLQGDEVEGVVELDVHRLDVVAQSRLHGTADVLGLVDLSLLAGGEEVLQHLHLEEAAGVEALLVAQPGQERVQAQVGHAEALAVVAREDHELDEAVVLHALGEADLDVVGGQVVPVALEAGDGLAARGLVEQLVAAAVPNDDRGAVDGLEGPHADEEHGNEGRHPGRVDVVEEGVAVGVLLQKVQRD